jgi:hypothetical protein
MQIQFEDIERYAYKVETLLRAEMCDLHWTKHTPRRTTRSTSS